MKHLFFATFVLLLFMFESGCAKRIFPPQPEFILSYVVNGDTVSIRETIKSFNDQPQLSYSFGYPCNEIVSDSVVVRYTSSILKKNVVQALFVIRKKAPLYMFDSASIVDDCKAYYYKEESDLFPHDFREGELSLADNSINDRQLLFGMLINNKGYSLQSTTDPFNSFKITQSRVSQNCFDCIDWLSLRNKYFLFKSDKIVLSFPTIEFQCKLKSNSNPNDTLTITNGVFQSLFVQERK